jgi:PKD domain-containing protein
MDMGASLRGRPQRLWLLLGLLAVLVAVGAVVALIVGGSAGNDHGRALALYGLQQRQTREKSGEAESEAGQRRGGESFGREEEEGEGGASEEGDGGEGLGDRSTREAAGVVEGRKGGEGERHGARTPWGEQVANRAYPRSYVDDKRALAGRRAFDRVRGAAPRTAFRSQREFDAARAAQPGRWTLLGPVTPNVAGEASQFFDPVTLQGPTTQESGRVAAIAVDPTCNADDGCRLWIATAGGGIWRTDDALAASVHWIPPSGDLPTNAFGSILYDAASDTLYAGSGEPNGSSDSEAGLGLFKSTDGGATWSVVPGSRAVATNRSIGAIAVDPQDPDTIYIGTAVARHGSSSSNGGRRTPPGAPPLGVYKSTDGGATFTRLTDLATKTPADPTDPATGNDFFAGGVHRLEFDPNDPDSIYAGVLGYGVWRSADDGATWTQVFHTMNQNDFSDPNNPVGDSTGDITEFDLVDVSGTTRAYLGDASDDWAIDGDDNTPAPQVWRTDDVAAITGDPAGAFDNTGWTELSDETNGTNGFLAYNWCQNGQCSYDSFVASPPTQPDSVWLGGSMNYDELPAYAGQPPRSNGRAVIRSTNGGAAAAAVTWQDMSAALASDDAWDVSSGLHPDEQAIAFSDDGNVAFVGSDGGVARVDVTDTVDRSGSCSNRQYVYDDATGPEGLRPDDLLDCQRLLAAIPVGADQPNFVGPGIQPLNNGLADLQFQSLSFNPKNPERELLGGTQDNGTWSYTGSPAWFQSVGGDGGQSGFDADDPTIRYHNYFDATPEVNYHGNNPRTWLATYDPLQLAPENRSFYTPFIADPRVGGRIFTGLEHVWRSDDSGAPEAALVDKCNAMHLDPGRAGCGDWAALGPNLATEFNRATKNRGGQYVVATTRAPSDDITLWAGTRIGRVFVSKNADADASAVQFSRIDTLTSPGRFVSGIAVDPADANHAWISFSGYAAYTPGEPGHVFSVRFNPSTGSAAWTDITRNIGDQPVTSVAFDADTGDLYASTDFGVLRLPRGSSTWVEAAPGLPRVAVYGLSLSPQAHVLYAATHGRSAYAIRLRSRPSVSISGPSELRVGEPVTFSASGTASDGGALTFAWQLPGTPATATGSTATFRPTSRGAAVVRVTATDTHGLSRTAEKPVTISPRAGDSVKPRLSVGKVKTVRRPRSSAISGRVIDAGGVARLTVRFGDGTSRRVHVGRQGRFKVRHRYGAAGRYDVTVTAIDNAGNRRAVHRTARVLRRR